MKRKNNAFVVLAQDVFPLIFAPLHDWQLNYWITQVETDCSILRDLISSTRCLERWTFVHILKLISDQNFIERTMKKCREMNWQDLFLEAPMWFLNKNVVQIRVQIDRRDYYNMADKLPQERMRQLHTLLRVSSWSKEIQSDIFYDCLYEKSLNDIQWLWDHLDLGKQILLYIDYDSLDTDVIAFLIANCNVNPLILKKWGDLDKIKSLCSKWPSVLQSVNVETMTIPVAKYLWPRIKPTYKDWNIIDEKINLDNPCMPEPAFKFVEMRCGRFITFMKGLFFFDSDRIIQQIQDAMDPPPEFYPPFGTCLLQAAMTEYEDKNNLFEDARQWMTQCSQSANATLYFYFAINQDIGALVIFLWNHASPAKQALWAKALRACFTISRDASLLRFASKQIPHFVDDNIDLIMQTALCNNNYVIWEFGLPYLSPREQLRACQWCMDFPFYFFKLLWVHVDRRHTSDLFAYALSHQNQPIAFELSKEPSFDPSDFSHAYPALIALQLHGVLKNIDAPPKMTIAEKRWCVDKVVQSDNSDLLKVVFAQLGLCVSQWKASVWKQDVTRMSSSFVQTLLTLEILSGRELYKIDQSRFWNELRVIHYDI